MDVSMENHENPLGIDPEQVTQEGFKFDKHVSNEFSVRNEVGLDELSQCIQVGQEKGPPERWIDCFNSSASQVKADFDHVLFSPKTQSSFMEEENGIQFLTVEEQRDKEKAGEESDTLEFFVCASGKQRSPAKFLHSSTEGENIMSKITEHDIVQHDGIVGMKESGSVINNNNNADSELQPLDAEEHEARNMENSTFVYLKLAIEIEFDESSLEKLEHEDTNGVRKLLQR